MSSHIRITASGWDTYTGDFGGVNFKNGLSVSPASRRQIDHLSALVRCDLADENGDPIGQSGISARLVGGVNVGDAPSSLRKATQEEIDADRRERVANSGKAPTQVYTKEELEQIANKEGIEGLRKIGDKWSVRDRAINKLIVAILNAQTAFMARTKDIQAKTLAAREAAKADALAKAATRAADIEARSKLVAEGGTSNAIGPDGQNVTIISAVNTPPEVNSPTITTGVVATSDTVAMTPENLAKATLVEQIVEITEASAKALNATPEQVAAAVETIKTDQKE